MAVDTSTSTTTTWDRWSHLTARGSTNGREVPGGLVAFFTMPSLVTVDPLIIGTAKDETGAFIGGHKW